MDHRKAKWQPAERGHRQQTRYSNRRSRDVRQDGTRPYRDIWIETHGQGLEIRRADIAGYLNGQRPCFLSTWSILCRSNMAVLIVNRSCAGMRPLQCVQGPDLAGIDPETREVARLFYPREDSWDDHFVLREGQVFGITPTGRATVRLLNMNAPRRLELRQAVGRESMERWRSPPKIVWQPESDQSPGARHMYKRDVGMSLALQGLPVAAAREPVRLRG